MLKRTGAEIIVTMLERQGIRLIAGIPGGMNLPLYDALSESQLIHHVLVRHEQAAGFIAQGMARSTGLPAVCFATSGPGATNLLTAIADAKLDSIPIICITGQVPTHLIGTDAFQEVDTYGMSLPVTKHNFLVRSAEELLSVIPAAFRIAQSNRPGPVLIDVPKDVQNQVCEFVAWPDGGMLEPHPSLDQRAIQAAAELINRAKHPVLYAGGGVVHAAASDRIRVLAEQAGIPCGMSLMGLGILPAEHPLSLGLVGMHGARFANLALEACDVLIACGSRFGDRTTGQVARFCPNAQIIHIDIDESEINKIKPATVQVVGDLAEALDQLLPQITRQDRLSWQQQIAALKEQYPMAAETDATDPSAIIRLAGELLGAQAIITTDVGQHQMWTAQHYPHKKPRHWLTSSGLGTMGFGLPAAIGASLAHPKAVVVCFSGDGSLLMNIQELATAVEEEVNVKILLFDNQALGLVHQQQDLFFAQRYFASTFKRPTDFVQIAAGFGMRSMTVNGLEAAAQLLPGEFARRGPCLIHIPITVHNNVYPMVPPGAANTEMIGGTTHAAK